MNFDVKMFDEVEAKEFGEFEGLTLGGHEIIIRKVEEYESTYSGNVSLKVEVDITGNDKQAGFFQKQFDDNSNMDKKWPTGATRYLSLKNEQLAYLKGFITTLEKSNANFKFNTAGNWNQLVNLKCAGVFGLEEYEKEDGSIGTATKLQQFRSIDKLNEIKIPKVRLLDKTTMDYEEYKNRKSEPVKNDFIEISNDMLPF